MPRWPLRPTPTPGKVVWSFTFSVLVLLPQAYEEQGWLYHLGMWLLQSGYDDNGDDCDHDGSYDDNNDKNDDNQGDENYDCFPGDQQQL